MNFFQRQDEARRASRRLVVLFGLAVIAVVVAVDLVVAFALAQTQAYSSGVSPSLSEWMRANVDTLVATSLIVVGIIGFASLYKTAVLSGGGGVVARALGGVRVSADTTDPDELFRDDRHVLNVATRIVTRIGRRIDESTPMVDARLSDGSRVNNGAGRVTKILK